MNVMLLSRMTEFFMSCRQNTPLFMGLLLGISLTVLLSNYHVDKDCRPSSHPTNNFLDGNALDPFPSTEDSKRNSLENDDDSSDYEPRINLAGKPHSAKKAPQPFVRPRYYSTELGIKEKIFVAVLTSIKQIPSLGLVINSTLTHHVSRLAFFVEVSQNDKLDIKTLPIVGFKDSQQGLLTLHTLKYLADKLAQGYNYFFLMKDTTFVNGRKLSSLVKHISVSGDVYMGAIGNEPTLNPNVCSLEGGILISSSVLQALSSLLESCNEDFAFNSDDEKIGLCIHRALKLTCQSHMQGQTFSTFNLDAHATDVHQLEATWETQPELSKAVTVFHATDPSYFYMLDKLSCAAALQELDQSIREMQQTILRLAPSAPGGLEAVSWPVGYSLASKAESRFSVLRWEYFNASHVFFHTEHTVVQPFDRAQLEDIREVVDKAVAEVLRNHPRWRYVHLLGGYKRFDPVRGMDYLIDLLFLHPSGSDIVHTVEACRPITHVDTVPMPYVTESSVVHIVVVLREEEQVEAVENLARAFAKNMLAKADKSELILVLPTYLQSGFARLKELTESLNSTYKKTGGIHMMATPTGTVDRPGIEFIVADLLSTRLSPDALIFLCHPFAELYPDVLNRIRINTISGWQVYSPIPFSEFNPEVSLPGVSPRKSGEALNISTNLGFYDQHDTWHISFYAADYLNARKTFETEQPLIRSERDELGAQFNASYDSLLSMFARLRRLHILRAVEPHLRLRYHLRRRCLTDRCRESYLLSQGTRSQLARFALDMQSPTIVKQ